VAQKVNYMDQSNTLKLCVDCTFFRKSAFPEFVAKCSHPLAEYKQDPVYGHRIYLSCQFMRQNACGINASLYVRPFNYKS
jgi:hypothetical protein